MSLRAGTPKIGIGLAAYQPNPAVFAEQLASIQAQEYENWFCAITCDSPLEPLLAEPLLACFREDRRFVWRENTERLGHKKNFERAIGVCVAEGAEAIACSDQDDVWYPQKLRVLARALAEAGPLALVHSDLAVLRDGKVQAPSTWAIERRGVHNARPEHLFIRNVVAGCTMLLDAELVRRFPVIPPAAEYHDHWYALVAAYYGGVHPVRESLIAYRQHGGNTVGVTPFDRVFATPAGSTPFSLARKCRNGWRKSHTLALDAARAGLPLTGWQRAAYLRPWDRGARIAWLGMRHYGDDPALARACFARSIGKALSV